MSVFKVLVFMLVLTVFIVIMMLAFPVMMPWLPIVKFVLL